MNLAFLSFLTPYRQWHQLEGGEVVQANAIANFVFEVFYLKVLEAAYPTQTFLFQILQLQAGYLNADSKIR